MNATHLDTECKRALHKSDKRELLEYETFATLAPYTKYKHINKEKSAGLVRLWSPTGVI